MKKKESAIKVFAQHSLELHKVLDNLDTFHKQVLAVAEHIKQAFDNGRKVLVAGNGGSASQAQHFSDEMVGRYKSDRQPYPVVALTADGAVITCIGNDFGFEHIFSRQVEALGQAGDVFVALSTSGNSKNILAAAQTARDHGLTVVALTGQGGQLQDLSDYAITVPAVSTARVQELHLHAIHLLCEALEDPSLLPGNWHENPEYTGQTL